MSKYKIPWILKWQYNLFSSVNDSSDSPSIGSPPVKINATIPTVSRDFYVKWWDKFNIQRIIGQVQAEFPPVPSHVVTRESKSSKSSKPSDSLHLSDIKECSASDLKLILNAVKERRSELSKPSGSEDEASSSGSQPSVNQDPYSSQMQDAQDPFA